MERRELMKAALASAAATIPAPAVIGRAAAAATPPNILFIMVDELRFPTVFPGGIASADDFFARFMPSVYRLWQNGVKFVGHYANANPCSPARGTLLSGLYSQQTWLANNLHRRHGASFGLAPGLDPVFPTWGKLLRSIGYSTAWAGKWHISYTSPGQGGLGPWGFDQLVYPDPIGANLQGTYGEPGTGYLNDADISAAAVSRLRQLASGSTPWCLAVSFVNPHDKQFYWGGTEFQTYNQLFDAQSVYQPITFYSENEGKDYPPVVPWSEDALKQPPSYGYPNVPPNWQSAAALAAKPATQLMWRNFSDAVWGGVSDNTGQDQFAIDPFPSQSDLSTGIGNAPFSYWQRCLDAYTWLCTQVDNHIGDVLNALPASAADNTVIVFTADHGEFAGAHGLVSGKTGTVYEEAYHIPLIVADPTGRFAADIATPRTGLTCSVDILRLLMDIAMGDTSWMKGELGQLYGARIDMLAMLRSASAPGRPYVILATDQVVPGVYNPGNAPIHVTGLRTPNAKLGLYAQWTKGSVEIDQSSVALEFYDYTTYGGPLELDSEPDNPLAQRGAAALLNYIIPNELRGPLPPALAVAAAEAKVKTLVFTALAEAVGEHRATTGDVAALTGIGHDF
jgi:arylsulfatase A-like enzyme